MSAALSLTPEQLEALLERAAEAGALKAAAHLRARRERPKKAAKAVTDIDRARAKKIAAQHGLVTKARR